MMKRLTRYASSLWIGLLSTCVLAQEVNCEISDSGSIHLGDIGCYLLHSFSAFEELMIAICYISGVCFAASGILKFKMHKDNPTQVPISGPILMTVISAALIYLPTIVQYTGGTLLNTNSARHGDVYGEQSIFE